MLSLTYNRGTHNLKFLYEVYTTIEKNKGLFYKYCGDDADYYMTEVYAHTLENFDETKGELGVYIRSLAKTISQNKNNKEILVDFTDETPKENEENYQYIVAANKARQSQKDNINSPYTDIEEALEILKINYPIELLYFKRAIEKGTTYSDASSEFILVCQDIIRQFPEMLKVIQETDLSDIKKELGLVL